MIFSVCGYTLSVCGSTDSACGYTAGMCGYCRSIVEHSFVHRLFYDYFSCADGHERSV